MGDGLAVAVAVARPATELRPMTQHTSLVFGPIALYICERGKCFI
jgi:hypothetical protein